MMPLYPFEKRERRRRWMLGACGWLVAIVLAHLLDHWVWSWATVDKAWVEGRDWWRLLRVMGYLGTWAVVWLIVDLARGKHAVGRPGLAALISAVAAGGIAEVLKLIVVRERPGPAGEYLWHGFFGHGAATHGMPSSHAAVAFGGMLVLAACFPRIRWVMIGLAVGCGVSRILPAAHFLSDVVVGAAIGAMTAGLVRPIAVGGGDVDRVGREQS